MTRLALVRRSRGIAQIELARRLGISATVIAQVERGDRRAYPKLRRSLSEAFGVPVEALFDADGWPLLVDVEHVLAVGGK
ncbi:MAG: helix-turn-helix domain-containing protein [Hydrogenibacillus schlegelii]|uniref:Helix-turn-helix domain-containing protein n=1 Tax=Hydrogenibacillus schlegelii TaxID=1484 RepID=A0A947GAN8_HYDSH|nr:helix-turn-helix domain-containing protein [Hydrogenibacillus schlegelii]